MDDSKNYFKRILGSPSVYLFILLVIVLYLSTLSFVFPRTDDDYIGEQVYWFNKLGYVKSELMRGFGGIGLENLQTVYHKLFIYQGVLFTKIFGWSLFSLHLVSLFYAVLFFIIFYLHLKREYENFKEIFILALVIMLLHNDFSIFSCAYRPEVMLMTIGFISYVFLNSYIKKNKNIYLVLSGIFAGLAFLTHLNGLIFVVAGWGLLILNKKYIPSFIFGIASAVSFSVYFVDILHYSSFKFFIFQFTNDPSLHKDDFSSLSPLWKILEESMRFFHSEKEISFSILLILSLIFSFKYLKRRNSDLVIYTAILVGTLAFYTYSKTTKYVIIYLPFLVLIITEGWKNIELYEINYKKFLCRSALACYIVLGLYLSVNRAYVNIHTGPIADYNAEISSHLEGENLNILAPGPFIFNEIEGKNRIMNLLRFTFFIESQGKPMLNFEQMIDSANTYDINYIVLDKPTVMQLDAENYVSKSNKHYSLIRKRDDYMIIKLSKLNDDH